MENPTPSKTLPHELNELPPAVIPSAQRDLPDVEADSPMHGTDADNRAIAAGEGSGNSGGTYEQKKMDFAGDA